MLAVQVSYLTLQEQKRHNLATEGQARDELAETKRSHLVSEDINRSALNETIRSHKINEALGSRSLDETIRHNKATEGIQNLQAKAALSQANTAAQRQKLAEKEYEETSWTKGAVSWNDDTSRNFAGMLAGSAKIANDFIPF